MVDADTKSRAIAMRERGASYREIKETLGVGHSTIGYWLNSASADNNRSKVSTRYHQDPAGHQARRKPVPKAARTVYAASHYKRYRHPEITYFIECQGFVKIGRTKNISRRMIVFATSNPFALKLLGTCSIGESQLHQQFSHLRHQGEWFHATDELLQYIESVRE